MYWALTTDLVDKRGSGSSRSWPTSRPHQWARAGRLEVTAISLAATRSCRRTTRSCRTARASAQVGPVVVAREPLRLDDLAGREIVVPAMTTPSSPCGSCWATSPTGSCRSSRFPGGGERPRRRGLLIHEGQLTFADIGLQKIVDLGECGCSRRAPAAARVNVHDGMSTACRSGRRAGEAIACGLDNRAEALEYALQFGRGIDEAVADRFIAMY